MKIVTTTTNGNRNQVSNVCFQEATTAEATAAEMTSDLRVVCREKRFVLGNSINTPRPKQQEPVCY